MNQFIKITANVNIIKNFTSERMHVSLHSSSLHARSS
jgi:hypothetical protein